MATLDEALQALPFWDKLTDEQKQMARTASRIVPYKKGEMIHSCTGECLGLIAVQTGKIRKDTVSALQIMSPENLTYPPEATTKAYVQGIIDKNDPQVSSEAGRIVSVSLFDNRGYA